MRPGRSPAKKHRPAFDAYTRQEMLDLSATIVWSRDQARLLRQPMLEYLLGMALIEIMDRLEIAPAEYEASASLDGCGDATST